ncbi:MAG TPA: flavin reductase family protein [Sandaracinaceae bacterium LLY-WYZ-13_1]|nr:flavin reductase family protein [Sandaracinaceae bacterium LLY-WYZ-13_1]
MDVDPRTLSAVERYKILAGCVTPRPIAFVSSVSPAGEPNLAPFSFFNGVGADPMVVVFSPLTMSDGDKDTLRNVAPPEEGGTGEMVVHASVERIFREMAACAEDLPHGRSEMEMVGLTAAPTAVVKPPRVAEAPVAFECRTLQIVRTNPGRPMAGNLVIAEVVHVWLDDGLADERWRVDQDRLRTVGRLGGPSYCRTRPRFDFVRGREALITPLPFDPEGE